MLDDVTDLLSTTAFLETGQILVRLRIPYIGSVAWALTRNWRAFAGCLVYLRKGERRQ